MHAVDQQRQIEQQQRTIQQLESTIQEIQRRNEEEKKSLQEVIAEKHRALASKEKEQEKLKEQTNWEVEVHHGECKRLAQEIESLREKLIGQQQLRSKLQETMKKYRQQLQELQNAHQSQKKAQSEDKEEEDGDDEEPAEGELGSEIEIDEEEREATEEKNEVKEDEEYDLMKLGRYLLLLLQETRKAIDIGKNRQSPHVQVLLSLWSALPLRFVEEHLHVSKNTLSKYRMKKRVTVTPHGTIPGSGAPSEEKTRKKSKHWIHFEMETTPGKGSDSRC